MSTALAASYAFCRKVARARAKNFYYSFLLLDPPRRDAMCAIYAFMRHCDDLSDGPQKQTGEAFCQWRNQMEDALDGRCGTHSLWPAFADAASRYGIPRRYFEEMIDGVWSDLEFQTMQSFEQLYGYCYRVASVVGLSVVHVLGYRSGEALPLAEKCGVAFQLTNILRDVREDYDNGRVYLPAEDLRRFGVEPSALAASIPSEAVRRLLAFEAERARGYYRESAPLVDLVEPPGRPMLWALIETYWRLLDRIEASGFDVLRQRISLPLAEKLWIMARARFNPRPRPLPPAVGPPYSPPGT
jgi:phytoene synthase